MSVQYQAVGWNRQKKIYDTILLTGVAAYLILFIGISSVWNPNATIETLLIRGLGTAAFLLLHVVLCIGPLCRFDRRFLPLLYNRRHFGVLTFLVALTHAYSVVDWFSLQGAMDSLITEMTDNPKYRQFIGFPIKALGLTGLSIMFLLAATSHDFWLAFLSPRVWKALHMLLYVAYGVLVMHVALGVMQHDRRIIIPLLLGSAFAGVTLLHMLAAWRERQADRGGAPTAESWIAVGAPDSIPDTCARIVTAPSGERIAVFRDGRQIGALTNLCAHQNGPLGEGRIINGCVTCPWHGYEYRLEDGCAPPPFTEKLATYRVRLRGGIVEVDPQALPPGTKAAMIVP
jgi:nitrite reductase/ring-hydroxylating ferredoxin subunit/DMSO/TMAO reductase YedYZ heme-binding membrane subunit